MKKNNYKKNISNTSTSEEFEKIYSEIYAAHIYPTKKLRKTALFTLTLAWIFIICFFINLLLLKININTNLSSAIVFSPLILFFLFVHLVFVNIHTTRIYQKNYRENTIFNLVKKMNVNLSFNLDKYTFSEVNRMYSNAAFDDKHFSYVIHDTFIEGYLDEETYIKIIDINVNDEVGIGRNKRIYKVFSGIFAIIDSYKNRDIGTFIKISKNKLKILNEKDRVEMDSSQFEKYFDIYSEDKILTMRLLTSDIMNQLIDFNNKSGIDFEIVFRNGSIYFRFFIEDLFKPSIYRDATSKKTLFIHFSTLKFIMDVTQKINETFKEIEL